MSPSPLPSYGFRFTQSTTRGEGFSLHRELRFLTGGTGASGASGGIFNFFLTFSYGQASKPLSGKKLRTFETDELLQVVASPFGKLGSLGKVELSSAGSFRQDSGTPGDSLERSWSSQKMAEEPCSITQLVYEIGYEWLYKAG